MKTKKDLKHGKIDLNSKEVMEIVDKNITLIFKNSVPEAEKRRMEYVGQACFGDGIILGQERIMNRFEAICRELIVERALARQLENLLARLTGAAGKA